MFTLGSEPTASPITLRGGLFEEPPERLFGSIPRCLHKYTNKFWITDHRHKLLLRQLRFLQIVNAVQQEGDGQRSGRSGMALI